MSTTKSMTV